MNECAQLVRAENINAFYSMTQKALVISAEVTMNPYSDTAQICRNPLEGLLPGPPIHEYMVVGTARSGVHPDLAVKRTICASFPSDATPAKVAVYSMGIDNPTRLEVSVRTQPQGSVAGQALGKCITGGSKMNNQNSFAWDQNKINALANAQATALRVARQVLKPVGPQGGYVDSVLGHRVERGRALSVRPNQHLQPLQMSRHFLLLREQCNDEEALQTLALFAAADMAQAEDAVVLLGAEASPFLKKLEIELDQPFELDKQEGLFDKQQKEVVKPILDSILEGIETLQKRGQFGDYYAIVSPALYREAYTNQKTPMDAPIYQIQPLLAKNGFLFSEAAEGKRGVIFSLARGTINLAVPMDTYVERLTDDDKGQPRFRVAEQMRLVVDDPGAREALK